MWLHSQCQYSNASNNNSPSKRLSLYSQVIKMWFHSQSLSKKLSLYSRVIKMSIQG